jgi:hypothetical protein
MPNILAFKVQKKYTYANYFFPLSKRKNDISGENLDDK